MSPKTKQVQKKAVKTTSPKAVAVSPSRSVAAPKRNQAWGGVIPKDNSGEAAGTADFCNKVAEIYGVPSLGVNAMGGNPYLNKDGRLFLLYDVCKGKDAVASIDTEYLQMSTGPTVPAIAKVTIRLKNGLTVSATGEASTESVQLKAVQKTLNMMAETRATNRAIWKIVAQKVWDRVAVNIASLAEADKQRVINAGKTSAEEMDRPETTPDEKMIAVLKAKVDTVKEDDGPKFKQLHETLMASKVSDAVKVEVGKYIAEKRAAADLMLDLQDTQKQ